MKKTRKLNLRKATILLLNRSAAIALNGGSVPTVTQPRISCKIACVTPICRTDMNL